MLTEKIRARFFDKINKKGPNGCWIWLSTKTEAGYGRFHVPGDNGRKMFGAHRLSYIQHYGPIPEGMCVCHHCDNPLCVNPEHLFIGTHQDNMTDMKNKGRARSPGFSQKGESNPRCKLSKPLVLEIASMLNTLNNKQISESISGKVSHSMISRIRRGRAWNHVTGIEPVDVEKYSSLRK